MKKLGILLMVVLFIIGCNKPKESEYLAILSETDQEQVKIAQQEQSEAYTLFKNTCYACHSVISKSHDEIIAPPMLAVKRRYLMSYPEKEDFINAVVDFAIDPTDEKALMFGAVRSFKVMTNLNYKEEDLKKIALYIYDNDIEKPEWFEAYFNEEHGGNMGGKVKGFRNRN